MSDMTQNSGGERDRISDHEYDGIQEYDNPTPGWWIWVFVITVVFSGLYFVYYHSGVKDRSVYDRLADDASADSIKRLASLPDKDFSISEANMLKWMGGKDKEIFLDYGRGVFKQNCVACHGNNGEGLVGPNLTDDYFKNIKVLTDVPRVVKNGANNGAMPGWSRLGDADVALVSAYVASLRGKNVPSGIAPPTLGDKIEPWPLLPKAASAPATKTGN